MFVNSESILFLYSIVFGIIKVFIIAVSIVLLTTVLIKGVFEDSQMIIENVKFDTNKDNRQFKLSEEEKLKVLTRLNTKLNRSLSQTDKASLNNKDKLGINDYYRKKKAIKRKRVIFAEKMEEIRFVF